MISLETRRAVRSWALDAPRGTGYIIIGAFVAIGVVGVYAGVDVAVLGGVLGAAGYLWLLGLSESDLCPQCNSEVIATAERYCSTCGHRLEELPAAPPIDERVAEEARPVDLERLERGPAQLAAADGGSAGAEVLVRGGDSATRDDVAELISEAGIRDDAIHTVEQRDDVDGERGGEP